MKGKKKNEKKEILGDKERKERKKRRDAQERKTVF